MSGDGCVTVRSNDMGWLTDLGRLGGNGVGKVVLVHRWAAKYSYIYSCASRFVAMQSDLTDMVAKRAGGRKG